MEHYEIEVRDHLDSRRAHALGCEFLRLLPDGRSVLTFTAVDQAALYGLLSRLRDAGLQLVATRPIADPASPDGAARGAGPRSPSPRRREMRT